MKLGPLAITLFAIACILGGLTGYFKAESIPSLLTGVGGGAVLFFCARAIKKKGSEKAAYLALMLSLAIGVKFGISYKSTMQFMPHLFMVILALLSVIGAFPYARRKKAKA